MQRTRIKICGITSEGDALAAVRCGVDSLGFNFHPASPRFIEPARAAAIKRVLPPFVCCVGLLVDLPIDAVRSVVAESDMDVLQFHGAETAALCDEAGLPYIKALPAKSRQFLVDSAKQYPRARALLIDTAVKGQFGGTGVTFDWSIVPTLSKPVIVAGGLDAVNVRHAMLALSPYAVDVSGGVEKAKGIKDEGKMNAFVNAVNTADKEQS